MNAYTPILVLGALAAGFAVFSVAIAPITGPRDKTAQLDRYEYGIEPSPVRSAAAHFGRYFIIAMLFIVFESRSSFTRSLWL